MVRDKKRAVVDGDFMSPEFPPGTRFWDVDGILVASVGVTGARALDTSTPRKFSRSSANRNGAPILEAAFRALVEVSKASSIRSGKPESRSALDEKQKTTLAVIAKADPALLLKALRAGHDKANLLNLDEPKLVWPDEQKPTPGAWLRGILSCPHDNIREFQILLSNGRIFADEVQSSAGIRAANLAVERLKFLQNKKTRDLMLDELREMIDLAAQERGNACTEFGPMAGVKPLYLHTDAIKFSRSIFSKEPMFWDVDGIPIAKSSPGRALAFDKSPPRPFDIFSADRNGVEVSEAKFRALANAAALGRVASIDAGTIKGIYAQRGQRPRTQIVHFVGETLARELQPLPVYYRCGDEFVVYGAGSDAFSGAMKRITEIFEKVSLVAIDAGGNRTIQTGFRVRCGVGRDLDEADDLRAGTYRPAPNVSVPLQEPTLPPQPTEPAASNKQDDTASKRVELTLNG